MIFQCRVNPTALWNNTAYAETLGIGNKAIIDSNFSNNELEWLIHGIPGTSMQ